VATEAAEEVVTEAVAEETGVEEQEDN
jgi:hypothetical protein